MGKEERIEAALETLVGYDVLVEIVDKMGNKTTFVSKLEKYELAKYNYCVQSESFTMLFAVIDPISIEIVFPKIVFCTHARGKPQ